MATTVRPSGVLERIVADKRVAVAARAAAVPRRELEARLAARAPIRSFADALTPRRAGEVRLLAELKRASPVAGVLAATFDPVPRAPEYTGAGAAALSVLTDPHFRGSLDDLALVCSLVTCPVLQKDFVLEPYQVWEAAATGADAVLLIVALLAPDRLAALHREATGLGLAVLVEVHEERELAVAADLGAAIIGINNRDLRTFTTDIGTTERLRARVPAGTLCISESGIATRADVVRLARAGVQAMLVGEALSRSGDPRAKIAELLGTAA